MKSNLSSDFVLLIISKKSPSKPRLQRFFFCVLFCHFYCFTFSNCSVNNYTKKVSGILIWWINLRRNYILTILNLQNHKQVNSLQLLGPFLISFISSFSPQILYTFCQIYTYFWCYLNGSFFTYFHFQFFIASIYK